MIASPHWLVPAELKINPVGRSRPAGFFFFLASSMNYVIQFKPRALKDLKKLPARRRRHVIAGIEALEDDLRGDVKKLTNFTPEYRLRIGVYRVLFEVVDANVIVYRVLHRKDAYK